MRKSLTLIALMAALGNTTSYGQGMSVNTTGATAAPSAMLDVSSTTQGILVPRMKQADRDAIASPATGLLIYQTDNTTGFYVYTGAAWTAVSGVAGITASSTDVLTNKNLTSNTNTFPTLNQNTTGNAATVTTNANLTGDVTSVGNATTYSNVVPAGKGGAGSINGLLKANGSGTVSQATAGTDYLTPTGSAASLTSFPTLNQNTTGNAATVTTNANLTGVVTSIGNITTIGTDKVTSAMILDGTVTGTDIASGTVSVGNMATSGTLPAFNGSALTNLTGSNITSGTIPAARLGTNSGTAGKYLDGTGNFSTPGTLANGSAAGQIYLTGSTPFAVQGPQNVTGDVTISSTAVTTLKSVITAGSVGSASAIPVITYDANGRITAVATATPSGGGSGNTYAVGTLPGSHIISGLSTAVVYFAADGTNITLPAATTAGQILILLDTSPSVVTSGLTATAASGDNITDDVFNPGSGYSSISSSAMRLMSNGSGTWFEF